MADNDRKGEGSLDIEKDADRCLSEEEAVVPVVLQLSDLYLCVLQRPGLFNRRRAAGCRPRAGSCSDSRKLLRQLIKE
jgi:hypothetical protein